eukprot:TRINITY_DN16348_c0_g1_i2.p1 TRINITY_DN16348_c0_g1~~TRINITY_DN16348_c0_g1_i2.p1  ORF type:complete len:248 (+),score=34.36 TRINITY_DN16348_c0_g1_i2:62-805(+)
MVHLLLFFQCFFFQAEDGIRDAQESRGLGDVYKRQDVVGNTMDVGNVMTAVSMQLNSNTQINGSGALSFFKNVVVGENGFVVKWLFDVGPTLPTINTCYNYVNGTPCKVEGDGGGGYSCATGTSNMVGVFSHCTSTQSTSISETRFTHQIPPPTPSQSQTQHSPSISASSSKEATSNTHSNPCLLYTSDAADEEDSVDLGGRRIIKKKKRRKDEVYRVHHEDNIVRCMTSLYWSNSGGNHDRYLRIR